MPNIQTLLSDSQSNHKLTDFVKRYWHFAHILEMSKSRFVSDYCKWAKKQEYYLNERKANDIFARLKIVSLYFQIISPVRL